MKIRIGTRGSKLALWQAYYVQDRLESGGVDTEIVTIETKGDKQLNVAINKIGSKGVFTEEIEDQLRAGRIDIAVHSAKDMQSELPKGFELIAFTEREDVHDVVVSHNKELSFSDSDSLTIGTSSTRRIALLKHFYPKVKTVDIRGNLQTRIRKMEEGLCDAILLAFAGVHRMEYDHMIRHKLPLSEFIPAVGQGSVAIEVSTALDVNKKAVLRKYLNDEPTERRLLAERAYLRKLQGGCSIPVFGLADYTAENLLALEGGIVSLSGEELIRLKVEGPADDPEALGNALGDKVIAQGGGRILQEIKQQI
ncbi:hydroxymethylbilane synthase [Roseivirga sp. BDSF3-8]|uniref:hydroxymethylbilane synthase n=1 Tax=Roseivirga sp. BDSF3-8 TaxID=3241598 RepID=UPI003531F384